MKYRISLLVIVGFICGSCQTNRDSRATEITGTYVREYSYKVIHPNTGEEIGTRIIRDTFFIEAEDNRYRISNNKWRKNDYDDDGWKSLLHSNNRPIPMYSAQFNHDKMSLTDSHHVTLFIDTIGRCLRVGQNGNCYSKVK